MAYDWLNSIPNQFARGGAPPIFRSEPLSRGLASALGPQYLVDQQASVLENVFMQDPARPEVRDGYALITSGQSGINAGLLSKRVNSLGVVSPTGATATTMYQTIPNGGSGRTYGTTDAATAWVESTNNTGGTSYDPGAASDIPTAQLADAYYILGTTPAAIEAPGGANKLYTSTNTDDVGGGSPALGSLSHSGVDICYMLGRGWMLTSDCYLHYSIFQPAASGLNASWARTGVYTPTTGAGRLQLSPNNSQVARGLLPWNGTSILAGFDGSWEEVVIEITDPFANSTRRVIEPRFGLAGRRAKIVLGQTVYFMDQFAAIRTLTQTINGTQAGASPLPISEPIRDVLPGRVNMAQLSKVHFVIEGNELHIFAPLDGATECSHKIVFNLSYGFWQSVDPLVRKMGCSCVTDVRGAGTFDLFTSNGDTDSPTAKVYRWKAQTYTDDGEPIVYTEWSKALHYGCPESEKKFRRLEAGFIGEAGVVINVLAQVDENGRSVTLGNPYTIPATVATSFPLVPASFPLTAASFPLLDGDPGITRNLWQLDDLSGLQAGRGRMIRFGFQFSTTTHGLWAKRAEWWATAQPQPRPEMF